MRNIEGGGRCKALSSFARSKQISHVKTGVVPLTRQPSSFILTFLVEICTYEGVIYINLILKSTYYDLTFFFSCWKQSNFPKQVIYNLKSVPSKILGLIVTDVKKVP